MSGNSGKRDYENVSIESTKKKRKNMDASIGVTSPIETNNRKFGQATRTLKACELCRKQKTRCFKSDTDEISCSRCVFLNKVCSFSELLNTPVSPPNQTKGMFADEQTKNKLDLIYNGVNELLSILKSNNGTSKIKDLDEKLLLDAADVTTSAGLPNIIKHNASTITGNVSPDIESLVDSDSGPLFQSPAESFKMSPFSLICNQVETSNIPNSISNLLGLSVITNNSQQNGVGKSNEDIISLNLLTEEEVIDLVKNFRRNYGRWVLFPSNTPTEVLVEKIRSKCPLLLTTCCCMSLRYLLKGVSSTHVEIVKRNKSNYRILVKQLAKELNESLLKYTTSSSRINVGDIEFLQALVILSIYSLSLSSIATSHLSPDLENEDVLDNLNLDAWYLSSIGLTTFVSKAAFGTLLQRGNSSINSDLPFTIFYDEMDSEDYQTLTTLRIFNHLTLVHLINSIFSGRMCVVDEIRLNYCTTTLSLPSSTNFDGRMVSEIGILLITYNYIQLTLNDATSNLEECEANYRSTRDDMDAWYTQWEYLFNQPAVQFVELCYHFCGLIVIYAYTFRKSTLLGAIKFQAFDIFDTNNVEYVLEHFDPQSVRQLIAHACQLLKFVNDIDSDAYFAYLSDQIHFCFYFSTILLIRLLSSLDDEEKALVSGIFNIDSVLKDIHVLLGKFHTILQSADDVIAKYELGVTYALQKLRLSRK